jgi:predicted transcriptional regulator
MLAHQPTQAEIDAAADEAEDDEAIAEYEAKGGISHQAIMAWVESWGTPNELPPPQIGD